MRAALAAAPRAAPLIVRFARDVGAAAVSVYVDAHPEGTLFHRSGWAAAANAAYGFEDVSLAALRGDIVVGLLPLIDVRAPLLGRSLVSTAFSVGGGPIADDDDALAALADAAAAMAAERRANYVELRSDAALGEDWLVKTGVHASFQLPLPENEDENLAMIPRKRRAEIRKAIKAADAGDLRLRIAPDTDEFYRLYAASLRDHGTPVFPKTFLDALVGAFSDRTEISIAEFHGEPVAALLSFYDKDTVRPYYIGATKAARNVRAAEYLYWSQMRRAAARGCAQFDFGRSKIGSGPYHFKKLWGAEPTPVVYRCKLIGARDLPDVNPNNPKFAAFVSMWRRLPAPVANRLGPFLAANFP